MNWTELCQANVDHYNSDPTKHNAEIVALAVVGIVVTRKLIKKIVKAN